MFVELSLSKSNFTKTQSDVILAQTNLKLSTQYHSASLQSISSKVDALDVKFFDQSVHLDSLDMHMGNMVNGLNDFIALIKDCAVKKGKIDAMKRISERERSDRLAAGEGPFSTAPHPEEEDAADIIDINVDREQ